MYNWSFLFVVLHKPTLLPSTFNRKLNALNFVIEIFVTQNQLNMQSYGSFW